MTDDEKLAEVISLVDRLKNNSSRPIYEMGAYPIFEGKGARMLLQFTDTAGRVQSIISYFPKEAELPKNCNSKEDLEKSLSVMQNVSIPFTVSPEVIYEAEIKGFVEDIGHLKYYALKVRFESKSKFAGFTYIWCIK